jgi:hypothetical protein
VNLRRVAPGDWAVGVSGAVLIGSLWLPWYHAWHGPFVVTVPNGAAGIEIGASANAWQAFAVNDVIFLAVGAMAIGLVLVTAAQSSGAVPIALSVFTSLGGILATILAVVRLIWPPDSADRLAGVWIGTGAAVALTVTALLAQRSERFGAEGMAHVEVTRLPAPRGNGA